MKDRTRLFALRIMKLVDAMPAGVVGKTIAGQIVRSGTSVGANYRSACRGRSRAEFAAKIGIALEEADETIFWLELIGDGGILPAQKIAPLRQEAEELTAVLAATVLSLKKKNLKSEI